jgi:hypothetical protein
MTKESSKIAYSRQKARAAIKAIFPDLHRKQLIHHIDGNPLNNDPSNFLIISQENHTSHHMRQYWKNHGQEHRNRSKHKATLRLLNELESLLILYNDSLYWEL